MELRKINQEELKEILELHEMWLNDGKGGERADLRYIDLSNADLSEADLSYADLFSADLENADLSGANLKRANLSGVNLSYAGLSNAILSCVDLSGVDLSNANLSYANLSNADLSYANLSYADLNNANLFYANLRNANLSFADLRETNLKSANLKNIQYNNLTSFFALQCPEEGSFIGYKKAGKLIVKLLITEDAKRSSATTRKCRCNKAKVLSITNIENTEEYTEVASDRDKNFIYKVGEVVEVKDFDENRWNECSTGIHFFVTREEAVMY